MATLSEEDVQSALAGLPGWQYTDNSITKEFDRGDFRGAVTFVVLLSYDAEAANHHPDLLVSYKRVRVTLSTHSEGGVTAKDIDLAGAIDAVA